MVDSARNGAHWFGDKVTDEYEDEGAPVGGVKLISVCLGQEPHLDVIVGLQLHDGTRIQVSGPYDTGSQISFVDE